MTLSVASNFEAIDLFFPLIFGCLASLAFSMLVMFKFCKI